MNEADGDAASGMVLSNTACLIVDSFLLVVCILQIIANFVVLYVWIRTRRLSRNDSLLLLVALAFIDFVYACEQFPYLCILLAAWIPDGQLFNYDPAVIIWVGAPSAALMKGGCTITTAIALDRCAAIYFPAYYYRQEKRRWMMGAFAFAMFLVAIDWLLCMLLVPIQPHPGASNFGGFVNDSFRAWWGNSNMAMNGLSCLFTLVIIYHLCRRRRRQAAHLALIERANRSKIDRGANRAAFYILFVSALIGVVPGCLNGIAFFIDATILQEVSYFVGTCATLSGLSHAFIFAMAHREIRYEIGRRLLACFYPNYDRAVPDIGRVGVRGALQRPVTAQSGVFSVGVRGRAGGVSRVEPSGIFGAHTQHEHAGGDNGTTTNSLSFPRPTTSSQRTLHQT